MVNHQDCMVISKNNYSLSKIIWWSYVKSWFRGLHEMHQSLLRSTINPNREPCCPRNSKKYHVCWADAPGTVQPPTNLICFEPRHNFLRDWAMAVSIWAMLNPSSTLWLSPPPVSLVPRLWFEAGFHFQASQIKVLEWIASGGHESFKTSWITNVLSATVYSLPKQLTSVIGLAKRGPHVWETSGVS